MKRKILKILATLFLAFFGISTVCQAQDTSMDKLSEKDQKIIPIAAFTASGELDNLKNALDQGLDSGLTVNEIKEILIHIYAYAGFPRALNGINTFISVMEDRKAQSKPDIEGPEATPLPENWDNNAYGHKTRNILVGRDISNRKSGYPVFTPVIDKFLVEHLFADIFIRDILSHQTRELVTISTLAAMAGTEPQLKGHLGIAMRMGYSEAQLKDYITILKDNVGIDVAQRANRVLGKVLGKPLTAAGSKAIKVTRKMAPDSAMSHVAISEPMNGSSVKWMEHVR